MHVAAALRRERKARGFSQVVLGRRAAISRTTLSRIENGDRLPSLEMLQRLADALDLPIFRFLMSLREWQQYQKT